MVIDSGAGTGLLAVIDGLGHGPAAAVAADLAAETIADNRGEPLAALMLLCHQSLTETRGAAITLAAYADGAVQWAGVGNVTATLVASTANGSRSVSSAPLSSGVVGYLYPQTLQQMTLPMHTGDLLVLVSDGIVGDYLDQVDLAKPAEVIAAEILRRCAKPTDDAMVLTARHRGAVV
ncbi:SpoIIE family protein phosphatase [Skermania sp. ID1734]|uniref:SpoIIE family protein phosphatase n=1 Tax=Skermania sp. ID1734 TaxID=2597516 RepID=UPI00351B1499